MVHLPRSKRLPSLNWLAPLAIAALLVGDVAADDYVLEMAPADRWASFRGTLAMTGVSSSSLPEQPTLLWSHDYKGDGFESTAAILDGVVYLPTLDGHCLALKLADGSSVWDFSFPEGDGCKSSPCVTADAVFFADEMGVIRCLDRAAGKLKWSFATGAEIISSPIVLDGKLYVGGYDEHLYCLDGVSGKEVWKARMQGPVHCSPTVVGREIAVAGCDGFLRLVNAKDGAVTRELEVGGNIASTPASNGSLLVFGTMGNQVWAVSASAMSKQWSYEHPRRKFPYGASPSLTKDLAIIGGRDKMLHALQLADGKERWSFTTNAKIEGSAVVVGDRVFFGSADGSVYGLNLADGSKQWEFGTGAPITTSPAVASGRLVIADSRGKIYCFGSKP